MTDPTPELNVVIDIRIDYMIHSHLNFHYQVNVKATQTVHQKQKHKTITTHHEAQYYSEGSDLLSHVMDETWA